MTRKSVLRRILVQCLPSLALALATTRADAQAPGSFELEWEAPGGCPTADEVRASVAQLLNKAPEPSAGTLRVHARVEEHPGGNFRCVVDTSIGTKVGQRTIDVESCAAAADSTALIVALILDPRAGSPREAPVRSEPAAPRDQRPRARKAAPERGRRVEIAVGPAFGVNVGVLPTPSYGLGAMGGPRLGSSSLEIGFIVWKSQDGTVPGVVPEAGGTIGLIAGVFGLCPALPLGGIDIGACLAAELGHFEAEGFGLDETVAAGSRWFALGAGPLVRARLGPVFSLSLRTDLLFALDRPSFVVDVSGATQEFHRPSPLVGRALLSLDFRFGS
jgi:hypothetical protein